MQVLHISQLPNSKPNIRLITLDWLDKRCVLSYLEHKLGEMDTLSITRVGPVPVVTVEVALEQPWTWETHVFVGVIN